MKSKILCVVLVLFSVALLLTELAYAVQAPLTPRTMTQSDGTTFKAILRGDERYLHIETLDGYTILHHKESNDWQYAILTEDGDLIPSGLVVGKDDPSVLGIKKHLERSPEKIKEIRDKRLSPPLEPIRHAPVSGPKSEGEMEKKVISWHLL